MRICEVKKKEVINLCNCNKLGYVSDLDINLCTGRLEAILVSRNTGFCGLIGNDTYYVIPYDCIKKMGDNLIFVEICEENCITSYKKSIFV